MAHFSVNQYLHQFDEAIQSARGYMAAELLSCSHPHIASPRLQLHDPESVVQRVICPPWDDVVIGHLKCISAVNNHDFIEAYKHQSVTVQAFNKILQGQKDENWALPIMYTLCLDLRIFAGSADLQLSKRGKGKPGETLEKAAELLMGCFRVCASDNRSSQEDSKRWGMLNLVNQLFKIYFKINKLHLCKPLIRAIDSSNLKDQFSISQLVTYRYYVGRKSMFESDFKNAEEYLTFSFQKCHKKATRNKRLILIYLIPVKMLLGHMPSMQLLTKYDLKQFSEVVKAVTEGNLLRLSAAMTANEAFFIKCGIYLILEKLKIITYRNLFKKVSLILKTHQIPIDAFLLALKFMQVEDIDLDEVHCILANLIYEGKIKGYMSHQHQKLVVSKQNAFPPLSSIS
ncbi:PCI domain-containing protein 2-like [Limulus polyphemus]|uniref:CSN12-like protein n=1 Tax=Limulus polyphemus TaxID=6850 RepID=A0ABM1SP43_LIMPO|nr:PCI domain-containing protein 2-like [Limulus polyphemus]